MDLASYNNFHQERCTRGSVKSSKLPYLGGWNWWTGRALIQDCTMVYRFLIASGNWINQAVFFFYNNVSCETAPKLHMSKHQLPAEIKGFFVCIHRVQVDDFPLSSGATTMTPMATSPAAPTSSPTVCRGASRWLRSRQRVGQRYRPHRPPPREWSPPNWQSLAASWGSRKRHG